MEDYAEKKNVLLSIIIPALNEATTIADLKDSLDRLTGTFEIILADGGSNDGTLQCARRLGFTTVQAPLGRGRQMNAGAAVATGEVLLFLHADTRLPVDAPARIEMALLDPGICGGNFSLVFDGPSRESRWLTALYPFLRWGGMCYGDSAIFIRREVFQQLKGYRDYALFEDCDLYRRMRRLGRFVRLAQQATTSSRRFEGRFLRTFAFWSLLQILYWLGVHPNWLARIYKPIRKVASG
jgi:rSAM/selenodomain-associated transferase 2